MQGHTLKLTRALHHLNNLQEESLKWFSGKHHRVLHERHPDGPGNYQVRIEIDSLPEDRFSVLVGDVLQNLRSSLDHLAYALADAATTASGAPKDFTHDSEFPIFGDEDGKGKKGVGAAKFADAGMKKIRAIDPRAQAIIKGLQPYHRGNDFRSHSLWKLHELCNIDKHRLLHAVIYFFGGMAIRVDELRNIEIHGRLEVSQGPVVNDTVIARYGASPQNPKEAMNMDFNPVLDIGFAQGTPIVTGRPVVEVLGTIHNFVTTDVVDALSVYL